MNFYNNAALVLDHLDKNPGSVKGSLNASGVQVQGGEAKRVLALVIETLKYKPTIASLLETVPLGQLERLTFPRKTGYRQPSSPSLLLVMLHDLLLSPRKKIEASDKWPPKEAVLRHQARLRAELVRIQIKAGKSRVEDLAKTAEGAAEGGGCRYVRYNGNVELWGLEHLHIHLKRKGFERLPAEVHPVPLKAYFHDRHLGEEVLVFNGRTNWWVGDEWYEAGAVILQDKASCMPAKVVMEGWTEGEGRCIDATAAPGNKTSYMSALAPAASITAFERDAKRYQTLETMLRKGECRNVKAIQGDFLESDPTGSEWRTVTRILLDPSCSGSGIVNRLDYLMENGDVEADEVKAQRLEKLAAFQLQMILHAFKFPSAKRIVYSTCSIHPEEDEQVVLAALQSKEGKEKGWTLAPRDEVLPSWERRGRAEHLDGKQDWADSVIRCLPEDSTNGFFVSCFVKADPSAPAPAATSVPGATKRKREKGAAAVSVKPAEDDMDMDDAAGETEAIAKEAVAAKEKTDAQAERARRKKQAQKKRRKVDGGAEGGETL
ncbi:putative nucleus protein [Dioszegia hungarica]|uniref:Nucleus protein n=1 Tax=Dioszegia hungarica TaxID=4972 RepID=A0AA38HC22_9TREE|nr:putative nucleus protein [Dioszegia hungarica]KAI9637535.1 putative nucleus protein [Dioszegia hungarica]